MIHPDLLNHYPRPTGPLSVRERVSLKYCRGLWVYSCCDLVSGEHCPDCATSLGPATLVDIHSFLLRRLSRVISDASIIFPDTRQCSRTNGVTSRDTLSQLKATPHIRRISLRVSDDWEKASSYCSESLLICFFFECSRK